MPAGHRNSTFTEHLRCGGPWARALRFIGCCDNTVLAAGKQWGRKTSPRKCILETMLCMCLSAGVLGTGGNTVIALWVKRHMEGLQSSSGCQTLGWNFYWLARPAAEFTPAWVVNHFPSVPLSPDLLRAISSWGMQSQTVVVPMLPWRRTREEILMWIFSLLFWSPCSGCKGGAWWFWYFSMWAVTMWGNPISGVLVLFSPSLGLAGVSLPNCECGGLEEPLYSDSAVCALTSWEEGGWGARWGKARLLRKASRSLAKLTVRPTWDTLPFLLLTHPWMKTSWLPVNSGFDSPF